MVAFRSCLSVLILGGLAVGVSAADRPNILWITSEDNGPYLGCYGDAVARTPNLDRLAQAGTRYRSCFSNAAVCAPARQTLITGVYASSLGGQHMRSNIVFPSGVHYFPKYLREAGYYTSNNSKTDYNGGPADRRQALRAAWDESSNTAHWRNRPDGKPFFAVFNLGQTHESQLFPSRWENRELKTDPQRVRLPAYLPDLPDIRRDVARYYDCLETMDENVGRILDELDADGLADTTIVFYFADHGGALPRGKSFIYDSGTHVPLIVRIPEHWKQWRPTDPGGNTDRLVSFVDFAATVLSLAGRTAPAYMQGQAFLGEHAQQARQYVHTFRGRRGERYDLVRGVRTKEFLYLRNYTPHLPVMQFNGYSSPIPAYAAWRRAWENGECGAEQGRWYEPKPAEELYAVASDPDNVENLAGDPAFAQQLRQLRAENERHLAAVRDSVFFAEGLRGREFSAWQDEIVYPLAELLVLGTRVSEGDVEHLGEFRSALRNDNHCVRLWGVKGCIVLGAAARPAREELVGLLTDQEPLIRIQSARALAGMGESKIVLPQVRELLAHEDPVIRLHATLVVDECDLLEVDPSLEEPLTRVRGQYAARVVERIFEKVRD